jgi:hypothetical protein
MHGRHIESDIFHWFLLLDDWLYLANNLNEK